MTDKDDNPLISIICICWNHEKYIFQCLNSILSQSYPNLEIIFIDNNSTDNSVKEAQKILSKSIKKYTVIERKENYGVSKNLNLAVSKCNGKYVMAISTDDWLTPDSIEKKITYLESNPQYALVYTNGYIYYENQDLIIPYVNKNAQQGNIFKQLLKNNFIFIIGSVVNLETLKKIGLYNENTPIEDWDICLRIAQKHKIGFIDQKLAYYRKHDNNISNKLKLMLTNEITLLSNYDSYFEAKIGKLNAYVRYYKLTILKKLSQLPMYVWAKKIYNNI